MPEYREHLSIDEVAKDYAIRRHREVNHHYDATHNYTFHLQSVVDVANNFIHLIPENDKIDVIGGCWVHDIIEDARETYNNVKKLLTKSLLSMHLFLQMKKEKHEKKEQTKNIIKVLNHTNMQHS